MTDVRYDSGNRLVAIGGKDCNRRHEKLKVIYVDKERVKRVFRIVQAHDDIIFASKFSPQSSDSIPLLPHKSCEFMNVLEGTDLGIFSVSKAENQAVQTEIVCVERIQQEAVQFFQGWALNHKGTLRNIGLIIAIHFYYIEDRFVLHGPKSKHVYTSHRMLIASTNHLAYEGTLVKPRFFVAAEGRCLSEANGSVSKSANDAGGGGGCERKNKYDEIYARKVSVRNKNMERK